MHYRIVIVHFLAAFFVAGLFSGCWMTHGPSTECLKAAERLVRVQPASCEDAAAQVDTLQKAIIDNYDATDGSFRERQEMEDRLSGSIEEKLKYALSLDSACVHAYLWLGDYAVSEMFYDDSLIREAKHWFALGLRHVPGNIDLLSGLAAVYEAENNLDSARVAYSHLAEVLPIEQEPRQALARLDAAEHIKEAFFRKPEESYLLLERKASYAFGKPLVAHLKLDGTGLCEMYDYYDDRDNPVLLERFLDSAFVDSVLGDLEKAGFLALSNPFATPDEWDIDFHYVKQWHLPLYRITLQLPGVHHSICIYGLGTISGRNALVNVPSITYIPELNVPLESTVIDRLGTLSKMWGRLFSLEVATKAVDEEFGTHGPIWSRRGTYRYEVESDDFVRVSLKTCEIEWSTSRRSDRTTEQDSVDRNVIFQVGDSLYALNARTGHRVYAIARNPGDYPYFRVRDGYLYVGRKSEDKYTLREFDFLNGGFLRTAECDGDVEVWVITEGTKAGDLDNRRISRQFEQLIAYVNRTDQGPKKQSS